MEYAARAYAMKCGKWGWEWQDVPADLLMRELAIESAEAKSAELAQKIGNPEAARMVAKSDG